MTDDLPASVFCSDIALKGWADYALCVRHSQDLLEKLQEFYIPEEAKRILTIAILRVCDPDITNSPLKVAYEESFLTQLLPNMPLSKNSVCSFLDALGKGCDRIFKFMRSRAAKVGIDDHLLVDGTLKTNTSRVNTFSEFSRKARLKGSKDIFVLYAFDLEEMEPVCSQCFPGNMLDLTSYNAFVQDNGIRSGILVGDKGFPEKSIEKSIEANPDLHYLNPLRRSAKTAVDYDMYDFEGVLEIKNGFMDRSEPIQYKKSETGEERKVAVQFQGF